MTSKEPPIKHLPGEGQKCQVNCHVKKNKAEDNIKKKVYGVMTNRLGIK